jgi:hypothetical protein
MPFDLAKDKKGFSNPNLNILLNLFPHVISVSFDGYSLVFLFSILPPKPWPKTIAGVSPYFTTDSNDNGPLSPFINRQSKQPKLHVYSERDANDLVPHEINEFLELVSSAFCKLDIAVTEVQYWKHFFVVVLEDDNTNLKNVPCQFAQCLCFYLFEWEMHRPDINSYSARRIQEPREAVNDDSSYEILRPGIMVSSGWLNESGAELLTTSGTLIRDSTGKVYMTVASDGFPNDGKVFHPRANGRQIGNIIKKLDHTDVSLVQLDDTETFTNETFESPVDDVPATKLQDFLPFTELFMAQLVYMNNPFTGYTRGMVGAYSITRIPSDDRNATDMRWIKTRWFYLGQDFVKELVDGVCGSVIWDIDGKVLGFFKFAITQGALMNWGCFVASDEVAEQGYCISP